MQPLLEKDVALEWGTIRVLLLNSNDFLNSSARISHYLENPVFAGRVFTVPLVQYYWKRKRQLRFEELFYGCNFSQEDLSQFSREYGEQLSVEERWLLESSGNLSSPAYFAILRAPDLVSDQNLFQCELTLKHELSHGLFYLNPDYREFVGRLWLGLSGEKRLDLTRKYRYFYIDERIADEWSTHIVASFELDQILDISESDYLALKNLYWNSLGREQFLELKDELYAVLGSKP